MRLRTLFSTLLVALTLAFGLLAAPAPPEAVASAEPPAPAPEVVFVYTGSVRGNLEPCG